MDPLLAQIAASPDDDRPRLVLADQLQQRGDPRGEFIALQCTLARHDATDEDVGDVARMRKREQDLSKLHGEAWIASAHAVLGGRFELRRGMIERVTLPSPYALLAVEQRLWEVAPVLRAVAIGFACEHLARAEVMGRIEEIAAISTPNTSDLTAIAESPHATRLRKFEMHRTSPADDTMIALVELPQLLTELVLGFDGRSTFQRGPMIERLLACPARKELRVLRLLQLRHANGLARGIGQLAKLERLQLETTDLEGDGLVAIARGLPALVELDLSDNAGGHPELHLDGEAFAAALPAGLRRLRLAKLGLEDKHVVPLAASPRLARLVRLDLSRNRIADAGAQALARSPHLRGLRELDVNANRITPANKDVLREAFPGARLQLR